MNDKKLGPLRVDHLSRTEIALICQTLKEAGLDVEWIVGDLTNNIPAHINIKKKS